MNATRVRITAQDAVLLSIISAAALPGTEPEVAKAIREIGAKLAKQWGIKHADLPDTRRDAGQ